jgi:hypothetical protein
MAPTPLGGVDVNDGVSQTRGAVGDVVGVAVGEGDGSELVVGDAVGSKMVAKTGTVGCGVGSSVVIVFPVGKLDGTLEVDGSNVSRI